MTSAQACVDIYTTFKPRVLEIDFKHNDKPFSPFG
jgi:hypothetical protein